MTDSKQEEEEPLTFLSMEGEKMHVSEDDTDIIEVLADELCLSKECIRQELNMHNESDMACRHFWGMVSNVPIVFDTVKAGRIIFHNHNGLLRIIARAHNGDYITAEACDLDAQTLRPIITRIIHTRNRG